MSVFYLVELHPGCFEEPPVLTPPATQGWRFFTHCAEDAFESCGLIFEDFQGMTDRTRNDFLNLWAYVFEVAKAGRPLKDCFAGGKVFHPVHSFEVLRVLDGKQQRQICEVHQFKKKRTDVRVLFVYGRRLMAFVTQAFEKDSEKTPTGEKTRAEEMAKQFLAALDGGRLQLINEQGGRNASKAIFGA